MQVSGPMPAHPLPPHAQIFFPAPERFFGEPGFFGVLESTLAKCRVRVERKAVKITKFQ